MVTEPSIVTVPLPARMADAIVLVALPAPDGAGEDDDAAGPPRLTTSAGPRSQTRNPSAAPLRLARWPATPVRRRCSPASTELVVRPAEASAAIRTGPWLVVRTKVRSPLVAFEGRPSAKHPRPN